jgi:hypothetical protein
MYGEPLMRFAGVGCWHAERAAAMGKGAYVGKVAITESHLYFFSLGKQYDGGSDLYPKTARLGASAMHNPGSVCFALADVNRVFMDQDELRNDFVSLWVTSSRGTICYAFQAVYGTRSFELDTYRHIRKYLDDLKKASQRVAESEARFQKNAYSFTAPSRPTTTKLPLRVRCLRELGLTTGASSEDIRSAYRRLAFLWHPDRHPDGLKDEASRRFRRINSASKYLLKKAS